MREAGILQPVPAPLGCPHAWDIIKSVPRRERSCQNADPNPHPSPEKLGAAFPHLFLPSLLFLATTVPWAHRAGQEATSGGAAGQAVTGAGREHPPRWASSRPGYPTARFSWQRACVRSRVCVSKPSWLGGVQALQAESTNLPLIKSALCNITYMSLHLTPIILRKAQALFQPVGLRASGADLPGT